MFLCTVCDADFHEETHLKHDEESDPLVIFVVLFFVFLALTIGVWCNARMGNIDTLLTADVWEGVCAVDPAERVHHTTIYMFWDTVDGVTEVLFLRQEEASGYQHENGGFVV